MHNFTEIVIAGVLHDSATPRAVACSHPCARDNILLCILLEHPCTVLLCCIPAAVQLPASFPNALRLHINCRTRVRESERLQEHQLPALLRQVQWFECQHTTQQHTVFGSATAQRVGLCANLSDSVYPRGVLHYYPTATAAATTLLSKPQPTAASPPKARVLWPLLRLPPRTGPNSSTASPCTSTGTSTGTSNRR